MRIAISGAQSTGKTTLLQAIKNDSIFKDFFICESPTRKVSNDNFQINEFGNDDTQLEIIKVHINNLKNKHSNIFYDRCLLDSLVYTHYLYLKNQVNIETLEFAKKSFIDNFAKYDLICYIAPEFDIVNDNIRSNSIEFRNTIKLIFDFYINYYNLKIMQLTGTIEDRLNQLKNNFKYFNLRVDIHQHLGEIPSSTLVSRGKSINVSVKEFVENLNYQKITDVVVLYSDYKELEEVNKLAPNTRLYGLQYISDPNVDLDVGKPLFKGVKLHNTRHKVKYDYYIEDIGKILDKLPDNSIILYHIQNRTRLVVNDLDKIQMLAIQYPNLKHILGHSGAYGGMMLGYPKDKSNLNEFRKRLRNFCNFTSDFNYSTIIANNHSNVFCDAAILNCAKYKAKILGNNTIKVGIGTDFNFGTTDSYSFNHNINTLAKHGGVCRFFVNKSAYIFLNEEIKNLDEIYEGFQSEIYNIHK